MGAERALWLAIATYVLVFALKLGAYFTTGVLALLAEAFHSLADLVVSGFLLLALRVSRTSADERHLFGHLRAQNVAALVAATLFVTFTSLRLYEEAIPRLFAPGGEFAQLWIAIAIVLVAMVLAALPLVMLRREAGGGAAAKAQLTGLVNDELGLIAVLIGTLFVAAGWPIADALAAIVVATVIAWEGVKLFRENASLLLGEAPASATLRRIEAAARAVPGVVGVHDLRAERTGPDGLHAGFHLQVAPTATVAEADRIAEEVRARVRATTDCTYCVIQIESKEG